LSGVPFGGAGSVPVLSLDNVSKTFKLKVGPFRTQDLWAVNGVTLHVGHKETVGLVGESGCGKTTVARMVMKFENATSGEIRLGGQDIAHLSAREFRSMRRRVQMIFQDPTDSLNPRMTAWQTISEPLYRYTRLTRAEIRESVSRLLVSVGLREEHLERYPHQLSIGQQQRVGVARAVILNPELLLLDEPTSALDVSVRGMILELLAQLQDEFNLSYLFISHDLSVVKFICNRINVMYLGMMVESGSTADVFAAPLHPYTQALLSAIPIPDPAVHRRRTMLSGEVPSPIDLPKGCLFHSRCFARLDRCAHERPPLREAGTGRLLACHLGGDSR
jgi:oligopeptide/dipeptide ABC transporter ATP-binding protein